MRSAPRARTCAGGDYERNRRHRPDPEPLAEDDEADERTDRGLEAHEHAEHLRGQAAEGLELESDHGSAEESTATPKPAASSAGSSSDEPALATPSGRATHELRRPWRARGP